jgi:hypothetical protein
MTDPLTRAITHFNAGQYREALLAFEERWHGERSDVLRALIQLSNAMNQLRLGLVTSPRHLLASAERLLAADAELYEGIDLAALRAAIGSVRAVIPDGIETGEGSVPWDTVPRVLIEWRVS